MNPVERQYTGKCTISELTQTTSAVTNVTSSEWSEVVTDQPCRLVVESTASVNTATGLPVIAQAVTLMLSSSITVKAGSRITVTQDGRSVVYKASGMPAVYPSHQEIPLELLEGWAV